MYSLNSVQIIGHLTENPEVRQLPNGTSVTDLNIKTVEHVNKEDGSEIILPAFHTVTVWARAAEVVGDFCRAGSQIFIRGRLKTDAWEDDSGKKRSRTKVIAEDVLLLDSRKEMSTLPPTSPLGGGLNEVEIIGNLTRDPEVRQTANGRLVGNFSLATNRKWTDKASQEQKEETEFHNIVLWGSAAQEAGETMKSGQKAFVRGRIQTRSWETPEGEKRFTTEIVAEKVISLGAKDAELALNIGGKMATAAAVAPGIAGETAKKSSKKEEEPELPTIQYESDIRPEDLPF